MPAIRPQQADAFVRAPDKGVRAVLLYGTDEGLAAERAKAVSEALAKRESPPGEVVRLADSELDADPQRLAVELLTVPMFGGAKIVRIAVSRRINAALLKGLLSGEPFPGALVVEAGSLRQGDALRDLFEKTPWAAAIGCHPDEGASLGQLVDEILGGAQLTIAPEARNVLLARLGADRALSRSEVEKLALYAAGAGTIEIDDVEAIVGDASEQAFDRIIDAAVAGDAARAIVECDRAVAAGDSPQAIILLLQRHLHRLHRVRAAIEAGRPAEAAISALKPPLFGKQRAALERQVRQWTSARLERALSTAGTAARQARLASDLEAPLTEALLMDVAQLAAAGQGQAAPGRR
jgi:DNA polymerase-3 subunit delta